MSISLQKEEEFKKAANNELERIVLRQFFDGVVAVRLLDNSISDSKIIKDTQKKLKTALAGITLKCSCAKRTWGGHCELCQASDSELVTLRNFFRVIRTSKKNGLSSEQIQEFIENTKTSLYAPLKARKSS